MSNEKVTVSCSCVEVLVKNSNQFAESIVASVHLFSDKTKTTLRSTALRACLVRAIVTNVFAKSSQWFMDDGHTLVTFLPLNCTQEPQEVKEGAKDKEMS